MNRHDPRVRQTIDRISTSLENAQFNTQASLYTFSETYVNPCLNSFSTCLEAACYPCIGAHRDRVRARQRRNQLAANRGRPEFIFDFYSAEWENDEEESERTGLLGGWGADELDRLLAGGSGGEQPKRHGQMNYGTRGGRARRKSTGAGRGLEGDPTILPGSSMFGFLERLPWKLGARGVRYKPSAADLQDVAGESRKAAAAAEASALLDSDQEDDDEGEEGGKSHRRNRSDTINSRSTLHSLSSRGDLFLSEDEAADAVPLDDEFAITLTRRSTSNEDFSSGRSGKAKSSRSMSRSTAKSRSKRKSISRSQTSRSLRRHGPATATPKSATESIGSDKTPSSIVSPIDGDEFAVGSPVSLSHEEHGLPTMQELGAEEEQVRQEEEAEVLRKREEARKVALERGLELSPVSTDRMTSQQRPPVPSSPPEIQEVHSSEPDRSEDHPP